MRAGTDSTSSSRCFGGSKPDKLYDEQEGKIGLTHRDSEGAIELLEQGWPTLAISLVGDDLRFPLDSYGPHHIVIKFHDIEDEIQGYVAPTKEQIVRVLEHTKHLEDADRLLVHCHAGKSRSPAMAIGILVQSGLSPTEAFERVRAVRPELKNAHYEAIGSGALLPDRGGLNLEASV